MIDRHEFMYIKMRGQIDKEKKTRQKKKAQVTRPIMRQIMGTIVLVGVVFLIVVSAVTAASVALCCCR